MNQSIQRALRIAIKKILLIVEMVFVSTSNESHLHWQIDRLLKVLVVTILLLVLHYQYTFATEQSYYRTLFNTEESRRPSGKDGIRKALPQMLEADVDEKPPQVKSPKQRDTSHGSTNSPINRSLEIDENKLERTNGDVNDSIVEKNPTAGSSSSGTRGAEAAVADQRSKNGKN